MSVLRPGDILFWSANVSGWRRLRHPFQWRIQVRDGSRWNHVGLYDSDGCVIEATEHGVRRNLQGLTYDGEIWAHHPQWSNPGTAQKIMFWARCQIGVRYGFLDIASCLVWSLIRWYPFPATHAMICSELVGLALAEGGAFIVPRNGVVWTPRDIADAMPPQWRVYS